MNSLRFQQKYMLFAVLTTLLAIPNANGALRGVSPQDKSRYDLTKDRFQCFDKSKTIPISALNDDYCDCADGSDEPGTSACPNGRFFCLNQGHISSFIPASRVDDGICDVKLCCDGSDELPAGKCPNQCEKIAAELRLLNEERAKIASQGLKIKAEYVAYGRNLKEKREAEMRSLMEQLSAKERQLSVLSVEKKRANEILELLEKGPKSKQHEAELRNTKHFLTKYKEKIMDIEAELFSVRNLLSQHPEPAFVELKTYVQNFVNKFDSLDLPSLYSLPLLSSYPELDIPHTMNSYPPTHSDQFPEPDQYNEELYDEGEEANENISDELNMPIINIDKPLDQETVAPAQAPIDRIPLTLYEHATRYFDKCVAPLWDSMVSFITGEPEPDDVDRAKKNFDKANEKYQITERERNELSRKLEELQGKSSINYGPENMFARFENECFEYKGADYDYEICPFRDAKQKKDGTSPVNLGYWREWDLNEQNYNTMKFENGAACWNGPARTMTVYLHCGVENKILSVKEPNKCEYVMEMRTPVLCSETDH